MAKSEQNISPQQLEDEAYDWVVRFASRQAGQKDIDDLKSWAAQSAAHAAAFERASRIWGTVGTAAQDPNLGTDISAQDNDRKSPAPVRLARRAFLGGAMAASAAGVAVAVARPPMDLWPSWSELGADYRTSPGERRHIKPFALVEIDMNTRTSIAKRPSADGLDRIEILSGEASVNAPMRTTEALTVVAGDAQISALNARFNVRRDTTSVCVTCLDGELQVTRQSLRHSVPAGQQMIYADGGIAATSLADTVAVTAWQSGLLIFRAMPVSEVITEVNRYRRGRIILTNVALGRERFSARFRIEGVEQIVNQLHEVFGARVTALPGGILLIG